MESRWGLRSAVALVACAAAIAGADDRFGWEDYADGILAGLLPTWRACQVTPALQLKTQ